MDITAFIRELLFGHDCVILPGFGGFIGNYNPARIDKTTNAFYPPVKQISFNRNLNHNDGLLVGKISGSLNINYGDARGLVEEFVDELRKKLSKGEKVVFNDIGFFINNQEGNVQFEPDRNINYHLNSYGLTSFELMPLEEYDVRKRILKYKNKEPLRRASVNKILWRAAVVLPLLAALIVIPLMTDLFRPNGQTTNLNPLASIEFETNKVAVDKGKSLSIQQGQITTLSEKSLPSAIDPSTEEKVVVPPVNNDKFFLITGSFKSKENADGQVKLLKAKGYNPEIMKGPDGFQRVSAMRCTGLDEAVNKKDILLKEFPGTWITVVK